MCENHRVFSYSCGAVGRRHGPYGYSDYRRFKPWLRDEFTFRCAFCLTRERWYPTGDECFGVDHRLPQSLYEDMRNVYENLLYVCNRCNRCKGVKITLDPTAEELSSHLRVSEDGAIHGLTREGQRMIDVAFLDDPELVRFRRRVIAQLNRARDNHDQQTLTDILAFPDDLPQLSGSKCGNSKPEGVATCYHNRRLAGDLPDTY